MTMAPWVLRLVGMIVLAGAAPAGEWSGPAEVWHQENRCVSYRARLDGPYLVVQAKHNAGWHTYAMDNLKRAEEKLAGKKSLGIDRPTEITVSGGLEVAGGWLQSAPKDYSKPDLNWFTWGFDGEALFAAKLRRSGSGGARIGIRGQACTESSCKNIDLELVLQQADLNQAEAAEVDVTKLIRVR